MLNVQNLEAVLRLASQSGDRVIILSENHEPLVIMNLASYQDLLAKNSVKLDIGQQAVLDNVNRDIALLHTSQADLPLASDYNLEQFKIDDSKKDAVVGIGMNGKTAPIINTEEEERYYIEPVG